MRYLYVRQRLVTLPVIGKVIGTMLCTSAIFSMCISSAVAAEELAPERRAELVRMVRQDCGSCHGLTLRGGLGTPLLPENLRDKPAAGLEQTILMGRPGTAMPPWKTFLTEAEAAWIVAQLLSGFPEEK